jgi:hypothetical protein
VNRADIDIIRVDGGLVLQHQIVDLADDLASSAAGRRIGAPRLLGERRSNIVQLGELGALRLRRDLVELIDIAFQRRVGVRIVFVVGDQIVEALVCG